VSPAFEHTYIAPKRSVGRVAEPKAQVDDAVPVGSDRSESGNEHICDPALVNPTSVDGLQGIGAPEPVLIHAVQEVLSPFGFSRIDHELHDGATNDERIALAPR
jgi:hypothetical protein